jgi:hypothetical protein
MNTYLKPNQAIEMIRVSFIGLSSAQTDLVVMRCWQLAVLQKSIVCATFLCHIVFKDVIVQLFQILLVSASKKIHMHFIYTSKNVDLRKTANR